MKLQAKKIKKIKAIKIWKNFTLNDVILLIFFLLLSYILSFYLIAYNKNIYIKFGAACGIFFPLTILLFNGTNGEKLYLIFYRMIKFLLSRKKYVFKTKKNKNLFHFGKIEKDYIWNKSNNVVIGAIEVFGKDITLENNETQKFFINSLTEFFNRVSKKITIIKLPYQVNLEKNINSLKNVKKIKELNKFYESWNQELIKENSTNIKDKYFIVFYAENIEELEQEIGKVSSELTNSQMFYKKLSIKEFSKLINEIFIYDPNFKFDEDNILKIEKVKFKSNHFIADDNFYSLQTINEFPILLKQEWVNLIFNSPSVVVWNLEAIDKWELYKKLNTSEKNSEFNLKNEKDRFSFRKMHKEFQALEQLSDIASLDNENILASTILLLSKATNKKDLDKIKKINKNNLKKWNATINSLRFRQFEAFASVILSKKDLLKEAQEQISSNIAYGWPFMYENYNDETFPIIARNKINNSLVFFDPRIKTENRTNHNMFILGEPGKGKTTFTKKLMLANYAKGDQVIIIDPQNEFSQFVKELNGQIIDLGLGDDVKINPLQIMKAFNPSLETKTIEKTNQELLYGHENFIRQWFSILYPDFSKSEMVLIIKNLHKIYKKYDFINHSRDISELENNEYPIISELIEEIENDYKENTDANNNVKYSKILDRLKLDFILGRYKNKFNNHSNIKFKSNLICFNVASLMYQEKEVFNSSFYLIISYLQGKIANQFNKN
uniref:Mbov_0397 family ICE element conjugal transfer ATPase n=1 Tax=[Mycoplasma] collis TaxID=2127 RepID=UPI00051C79F6